MGSPWEGDVTEARHAAQFELENFTCLLFPSLFRYATGLLFRRRLINKDISSIINFAAQLASGLVQPPHCFIQECTNALKLPKFILRCFCIDFIIRIKVKCFSMYKRELVKVKLWYRMQVYVTL